jgi:hypothetical protein
MAISTEICEASLYATTPSLTAGQTLEHNHGLGFITLNPDMDKLSLFIVVLHFEIE